MVATSSSFVLATKPGFPALSIRCWQRHRSGLWPEFGRCSGDARLGRQSCWRTPVLRSFALIPRIAPQRSSGLHPHGHLMNPAGTLVSVQARKPLTPVGILNCMPDVVVHERAAGAYRLWHGEAANVAQVGISHRSPSYGGLVDRLSLGASHRAGAAEILSRRK